MNRCPDCGKKLDAPARYCTDCGCFLPEAEARGRKNKTTAANAIPGGGAVQHTAARGQDPTSPPIQNPQPVSPTGRSQESGSTAVDGEESASPTGQSSELASATRTQELEAHAGRTLESASPALPNRELAPGAQDESTSPAVPCDDAAPAGDKRSEEHGPETQRLPFAQPLANASGPPREVFDRPSSLPPAVSGDATRGGLPFAQPLANASGPPREVFDRPSSLPPAVSGDARGGQASPAMRRSGPPSSGRSVRHARTLAGFALPSELVSLLGQTSSPETHPAQQGDSAHKGQGAHGPLPVLAHATPATAPEIRARQLSSHDLSETRPVVDVDESPGADRRYHMDARPSTSAWPAVGQRSPGAAPSAAANDGAPLGTTQVSGPAVQGRGDFVADGRGAVVADGRGDFVADGRGAFIADGRGSFVVDARSAVVTQASGAAMDPRALAATQASGPAMDGRLAVTQVSLPYPSPLGAGAGLSAGAGASAPGQVGGPGYGANVREPRGRLPSVPILESPNDPRAGSQPAMQTGGLSAGDRQYRNATSPDDDLQSRFFYPEQILAQEPQEDGQSRSSFTGSPVSVGPTPSVQRTRAQVFARRGSLAAVLVAAALGGTVIWWSRPPNLSGELQLDQEGRDVLAIRCDGCAEDSSVSLGELGPATRLVDGVASVVLAKPLAVGDASVPVTLKGPNGSTQAEMALPVYVPFRIRPALLEVERKPVLRLQVQAAPGVVVKVDRKTIATDLQGKAELEIPVAAECTGVSAEKKSVSRTIHYAAYLGDRVLAERDQTITATVVPLEVSLFAIPATAGTRARPSVAVVPGGSASAQAAGTRPDRVMLKGHTSEDGMVLVDGNLISTNQGAFEVPIPVGPSGIIRVLAQANGLLPRSTELSALSLSPPEPEPDKTRLDVRPRPSSPPATPARSVPAGPSESSLPASDREREKAATAADRDNVLSPVQGPAAAPAVPGALGAAATPPVAPADPAGEPPIAKP